MEMRDYMDLKKKLCKELEEISSSGKMDAAHIEMIDKLTHTIKNVDKIIESEGGEHSQRMYSRDDYGRDNSMGRDGEWSAEGSYARDNGYEDGNSYARRGTHYVRGHYSRDRY